MKTVLTATIALIGFFALAESLNCNKCSVGLVGFCLIPSTTVCSNDSANCLTGKATFPSISGFLGFNYQGCGSSSQCNITYNGTMMTTTYIVTQTCCNTDTCNPIQISSDAVCMKVSLTAAISAALVSFCWGSYIN
ncbi:uncharacterized protein LOC143514626 [Brachyhypopomus gauderio]|uniref:uncharacterized protein LOC143514626 n=1 Tax=Brachyhypopomus gauderio TaxID=698409 RepID=UPI0040427763